jgi:hypothetical protein
VDELLELLVSELDLVSDDVEEVDESELDELSFLELSELAVSRARLRVP